MNVDAELRYRLYVDIQMAMAGHPASTVLAAQVDSLAMTIAYVSDDIDGADRMVEALGRGLKAMIRDNWDVSTATKVAAGERSAGVS